MAGTPFFGRAAELADLARLVHAHRLVTIIGAGGAGKTRLALEVATGQPDAAVVELADTLGTAGMLDAVARAVGARATSSGVIEQIALLLGPRDRLLVLDNVEHLAGSVSFVEALIALLRGSPALHLIATSRVPLHAPGELVWPLPQMDAISAVQLYRSRAAAGADLSPDRDVRRLCKCLDNLPLAVEITAAHAQVATARELADELRQRVVDLPQPGPLIAARQRSLRDSLDWSHGLLRPVEQMLLRRVSVFAGGWTRQAAEAVAADNELDPAAVLPALSRLAEMSLVRVSQASDATRFGMHEVVRQDAGDRLVMAGEEAAARGRHCAYFAELAGRYVPLGRLNIDAVSLLSAETGNLRAAVEHALEVDSGAALRLVAHLSEFWAGRDVALPEQLYARALAAAPAEAPERGVVEAARARLAFLRGDTAVAVQCAQEAVELGRACGDHVAVAAGLGALAMVIGMRDTQAGLALLDEAAVAAGDAPDRVVQLDLGWVRMLLTGIEERPGPMAVATEAQRQALLGLRDTWWHTWFHHHRAWVHFLRGEDDEFAAATADAHAAHESLPAVGVDAFAWGDLAVVEVRRGRVSSARALSSRSRAAAVASGSLLALQRLNVARAELALAQEDHDAALRAIEVSRDSSEGGVSHGLAQVLRLGAQARLAAGDLVGAESDARRLLDLADAALGGNPLFHAAALLVKARVEALRGNWRDAVEACHAALQAASEHSLEPLVEDALDELGVCEAALGRPERARLLISSADAARKRAGRCRAPALARWIGEDHTTLPAVRKINDADAASTTGPGTALVGDLSSLANAVAFARRGRGLRGRPETGLASLTPAERQLADLASEGLTNAAIAARLFISPHTVKVHLAHTYDKLGVSGRAGLAKALTPHSH